MTKTSEIRSQARRAALAKAAAAQPTQEELAFAAGFCKAAEAMGVDPDALYKEALPAWLGRAGQAIAGGAKRFGSWIGSHGGNALAQSQAGQAVTNGAKRFGQLLAGGNQPIRGAFQLGKGDLNSMANMRGWLGTYWQGLKGGMGSDAASELRKVLAARLGAGAAGVGGLYGAGKMMFGGDE